MSEPLAFDKEIYHELNPARATTAENLLSQIKGQVNLKTAADIGCGPGYFSKFLCSLGYQVTAVDGREENVQEAKRRYPEIQFVTGNAEDLAQVGLGMFDLVLCFGLLYHLENPLRAIRFLSSITSKVLLVESMIVPGKDPALKLLDEDHVEDQGLNYVAFYPTESCLVKMLYRAGFPVVYGLTNLPDSPLYKASPWQRRRRTMLVASKVKLETSALLPLHEPIPHSDQWTWPVQLIRARNLMQKITR